MSNVIGKIPLEPRPFLCDPNIEFDNVKYAEAVYEFLAYQSVTRSESLMQVGTKARKCMDEFTKGVKHSGRLSNFVYVKDVGVVFVDDSVHYDKAKIYSHETLEVFHEQQFLAAMTVYCQKHRVCQVKEITYNQGIEGSGKTLVYQQLHKDQTDSGADSIFSSR